MPIPVEELSRRAGLREKIRALADARRKAVVTGNPG